MTCDNDSSCARRQGDPAASLYILISGRARLVRQEALPRGGARVEDEVTPKMTLTNRIKLNSAWHGEDMCFSDWLAGAAGAAGGTIPWWRPCRGRGASMNERHSRYAMLCVGA